MTEQTLYCALTYADARAAIGWLENAFGLVAEHVYDAPDGTVAHAQLRLGTDLVMLGNAHTIGNSAKMRTSPSALGGTGTLAVNAHVRDIDATYAMARAANATIVRPLGPTTHDDTRTFAACDREGYLWFFGTYDASPGCDLSPCLRYRDAPRAIAWLRDVCGFTEKFSVPDDGGGIKHSEMSFGASLAMLGSRRDDDLRLDTPERAGGVTGSVYAYCADPDTMFAHARSAGVDVLLPLEDKDYGSREFSICDYEGNAFSFGTYRP